MAAPPAGDARLDLVIELQAAVLLQLSYHQGPGADDGHIALEDVNKLGHLVQAGLAEEPAHLGDTGVVLKLLVLGPLLGVAWILQHFLQDLPGVPDHGAELDELEGLAVEAHPGLGVEDGLPVPVDKEGDLHDQHQRQQGDEADEAEDDVHQPLHRHVDHLLAGEGVDSQAQGLVGAHGGDELVVRLDANHGPDAQVDALAVVDEGLVGFRRQLRGFGAHKELLDVVLQNVVHNAVNACGVGEGLVGLFHPAQGVGQVDAGGNGLSWGTVQDADALDVVLLEKAGVDTAQQLRHVRPRAQDEDSFLCGGHGGGPTGAEQPLPQHPQGQGDDQVKAVGHQNHRPGVGRTDFQDVQQNAAQDEIVHRLPEGTQQLLAAVPPENAGEGVGKQDHHQIQQADDGHYASPAVPCPKVKGFKPNRIGQHQGDHQRQHIQRHKVQVLQPAVFPLDVPCSNSHWLSLLFF